MSLNPRQFGTMMQSLRSNGGFSASSQTGRAPRTGFMVSIPGHEQQLPAYQVNAGHIQKFAQDHADVLGPGQFIGGWVGGNLGDEHREVSLDVSQQIKPNPKVARKYGADVAHADARTSAADLSIARNQEAAYDVKNGIDLPNKDYVPRR